MWAWDGGEGMSVCGQEEVDDMELWSEFTMF